MKSVMETIREWKYDWSKQEQRYSLIAFGIDSNMIHDLNKRLLRNCTSFEDSMRLEYCLDKGVYTGYSEGKCWAAFNKDGFAFESGLQDTRKEAIDRLRELYP